MLQARVYDPNKKYKDKFRIESFVVTTEKANASNSDVLVSIGIVGIKFVSHANKSV